MYLIIREVKFGQVRVGESLFSRWPPVRVQQEQPRQQVNGTGVGPNKERVKVLLWEHGKGLDIATSLGN